MQAPFVISIILNFYTAVIITLGIINNAIHGISHKVSTNIGFRTIYNFSHTFLDGNLYTEETKIHLQKELYFKDIFIRKCRSLRFCTFLQNLMVYKI